ncbi:MAG: MATE family efflux transporter [Treponema sp.]|nr:MATE family efflux transporter [Treponema sp.]
MKTREINMTKGAIFPKLVAFSVPLVLSSVLQLFFNAADIIVVGRFAGEASLAAVGSTSSLINLLTNLFIGLSIGTNVVAANYYGANHKKNVSHTVHTAMLLSVYSGVLLSVVGVFGAKYILRAMQAPEEVLTLATSYLKVYFAGITATMIYNFGSALLRSKGDTQRPLVILFLAGVINVILNLFFVVALKMNVKGVALATVISQSVAAILIVRILATENDDFHLSLRDLSMNRDIFIRIIKIGIPAGFQGMMFSFSNVIIQSTINTFGSIVIAGNSAGINIEGFVYTSMNGFSQGTLTFCSQNLGSGNKERIKKAVVLSQLIVILVGSALGGAVVLFSHSLLSIFSSNEDVIQAGMLRLKFVCSTYALCGMMDCMGNAVRGIGHSMLPMIITLLGACGLRLLWIAVLFQIPAYHSLHTIFFGYPLSWLVTWIAHTLAFVILFRRIKPVL